MQIYPATKGHTYLIDQIEMPRFGPEPQTSSAKGGYYALRELSFFPCGGRIKYDAPTKKEKPEKRGKKRKETGHHGKCIEIYKNPQNVIQKQTKQSMAKNA